jgi:hypothetical protein
MQVGEAMAVSLDRHRLKAQTGSKLANGHAQIGWKMTVRYSIDKQRRLVLVTAEGCVMFDDVRGHQDRVLADPEFDASFDELIDATRVTQLDVSSDELRTLALRRIFSLKSRRAIVATKPHIFGMGRMAEAYNENAGYAEVEVFYSMEAALKWLGREEEKPQSHEAGRAGPEEESPGKRQ